MEQLSEIFDSISIEKSCLYLVSTPIGNLSDVSLRCLKVLKEVDFLLCEDIRVTKKLLAKYEILKKNLISYNDFNGSKKRSFIIKNLKENRVNFALVSDSGTPLISDPGYKLIKDCVSNNIKITHIPGPTSVISALILSSLPTDNFMFCGFFEKNINKQKKQLEICKRVNTTTIWFETAKRILSTLENILNELGNIEIAIARELTKFNEEIIFDKIYKILEKLNRKSKLRGEIVVVISSSKNASSNKTEKTKLIKNFNETKSTKDLSSFIADKTGLPKKIIYNKIIKSRDH